MSETMLRKHMCIPFLATSVTESQGSKTYTWARIDKSTIFALNPNAQTETYDYIAYETPVTEVDHYEPELPQEITMNEGNAMYDFIFDMFYELPVGADCNVPLLICFPGSDKKAWLIDQTRLVLGEMNTVDKKISFTLNLGGDIQKGYYTITGGVPTFSETAPNDSGED